MESEQNNIKKERERNSSLNKINSRKESINLTKKEKYFSFLDTFCFNFCIFNEKKRNFVRLASLLIYKKLSVEYFLRLSNNFGILKNLILNDNQILQYNNLPHFGMEEQMNEVLKKA